MVLASGPVRAVVQPQDTVPAAIARAVARAPSDDPVRVFYAQRGHAPLWAAEGRLRPEARQLVTLLGAAKADGLDPARYHPERLRALIAAAEHGAPEALAQADLALSQVFAQWAADLRRPTPSARMAYTDPAVTPRLPTPGGVLAEAAAAPSLWAHLTEVHRVNTVYAGLRGALADWRAGKRPAGAPADGEAILLANLERARALPRDMGPRFVLVDAVQARLWYYENGELAESMMVAVGRRADPTPLMAGVIRYALFDPYWNMPEALVRDELAPEVLKYGVARFHARDMEALSDWSPGAQVLDPLAIDWQAVADGRQTLRVRQKPGPNNTMGKVKLMLPNRLGIYLHDTPDRKVFTYANRTVSAGCIRLFDARRLAARLVGPDAERQGFGPERRVDLPEPAPVYVTYFTALPGPGGPTFFKDPYARDAKVIAELTTRDPSAVRLAAR